MLKWKVEEAASVGNAATTTRWAGTDLRGAGTAKELLPNSNRQQAGARGCRVLGWRVVENIKVARVQRELRRGQVQARARRAGAALGWSDVQQAAA